MKRLNILFLACLFLICCLDTTIVKENDEFVGTFKLCEADYKEFSGGFGSVGREYWVLKFDNGLVIKIDLLFQKYKPMSFMVGKQHDVYMDSKGIYKVRKK